MYNLQQQRMRPCACTLRTLLICLRCRFQVVDGKCPFCRTPNSYVVKVLPGNEGLPNTTLDLFTPTGDGSPTLMMPPQRTADDQLLTDLPQDLRRNTDQSREDFQRPGTKYASRTQLLDLSLQLGRGKVSAVPMMGTLECRRESLRLFQPQTQQPLQLAEAGLFGDRRQDHPQCFHCAGHVVAEGDPVTSHAQQFPGCRYLRRLLPCPRFPEFRKRRYSL